MHTSEYDYLFKLLLIGDSGVGKVRSCSYDTRMPLILNISFVHCLENLIILELLGLVLSFAAFCGRHIHGELY
jgi:hypothetical protein